MRCLGCGAEMRLVQVARDETMMVPGYEDQTFECPQCHEIERRRVFRNAASSSGETSALVQPSSPETPSVAPGSIEAAPTEPQSVEPSPANPVSVAAAPPIVTVAERSNEDDEAEEMLRRAIAMVRGPVSGSQPVKGLTDELRTPVKPAPSMRSRNSTGRVVQIRHDPSYDAAYAAKDTKSGLVVLRHQDSARLREMCARLGWEVVEDGP
jgi:hypothetical protein